MKSEKDEIIIEEFKTSTKKTAEIGRRKVEGNYIILTAFCIVFLAAILAGMFLLDLSVVFVCVILVLESLIGICLHDMPIWVHGLEVLISIVAGVIFGQTVFMVIGAGIYIAAILALHFSHYEKGTL